MPDDNFSNFRKQRAVLWTAEGFSNTGTAVINSTPIEIKVRHEEIRGESLSPEGNKEASYGSDY